MAKNPMSNKSLLSVCFIALTFSSLFGQEKEETKKPEPMKWGIWAISSYTWDATENIVPATQFNMAIARVLVNGEPIKDLSYHVMGEWALGAENTPTLLQAWVNYKPTVNMSISAGQFKYPFGYEAYPPIILWKFSNPSYVTTGIVRKLGLTGGKFRDIGIQAAGNFKLSKNFNINFKIMGMNGSGANAAENNNSKDIVGYLGVKIMNFINVGGSFYKGKSLPDTFEVDESAFGVQLQIQKERFSFQAEYIMAKYDANIVRSEVSPKGFYVYGTYMVAPNIEFGVRFDQYDRNINVDDNNQSRTTIALSYLFNRIIRVMFNYEIRNDDTNYNIGNLLTVTGQIAL